MIEEVVALDAKFCVDALRDLRMLGHDQVEVHKLRAVELVAANVSGPAKCRGRESVGIGEVSFFANAIDVRTRRERITHKITPGRDAGALAVSAAADFKWVSGLHTSDTGDLEPFQ